VLGHVDDLAENELEKFYDSLYEVDYELMDMVSSAKFKMVDVNRCILI
jgi:hypothetical protein